MDIKTILCAVDFSECSREALGRAVELAKEHRAELVVLHVCEVPDLDGLLYIPGMLVQARDYAEEVVAAWSADAVAMGAPRVKGEVLVGVAWNQIVRYARENASDLILIGTSGRSGLPHALLGSVAERVIRNAPCSVMVVRPAGRERAAAA